MVVRGRWRPTRRNIVPIVDSLSVVHPASFSAAGGALPVPFFRYLIYLLFLDTFVEQFVIARCRLGMYVRVADGMRSGRASSERNRERMNEERGRLGGGKEEKRGRERQSTERTASILTQAGSYRAAQTNKLGLYLELEGANAEDDEARGNRHGVATRARGLPLVEREKRRIQDKVSSLRNDTSGLYSGNAGRERDATALSASSSFFPGVLTKVSVGLSASRSFVAPFSDITAPSSRLSARG